MNLQHFKKNKNYAFIVTMLVTVTANFAYAQGVSGSFRNFVGTVGNLISLSLMPILISLGIIFFFWNLIHYIAQMGNEKEREQFKRYSVNGIVGIFILLSIWGIIGVGTRTFFGIDPIIPQFKTSAQ